MEDTISKEQYFINGFFESSKVQSAYTWVDDNGNIRKELTSIFFDGGNSHVVEMPLNQVIDYCQSIPFSVN